MTLHRLLGSRLDSRFFRHDQDNPLHADLVVVDEASMIDLEMMASLLAALGPDTALVLIGDKDQLASVEAGAVLGDLCRDAESGGYSAATVAWVAEHCLEDIAEYAGTGNALAQQTAMLRRNYRFGTDSGIGQLARAVNRGDTVAVDAIWQQQCADVHLYRLRGVLDQQVEAVCVAEYRHYLSLLEPVPADTFEDYAAKVLQTFGRFQLLTALREGPAGVSGLNRRIAHALHQEGLIARTDGWYAGRPIMVTRNDYRLDLMNGDIGIALVTPEPTGGQRLRVAFQVPDGRLRLVLPSRLDAVETVYAMTVHKSQGSEFAHTALMLPETRTNVLTRELLYTAVTRASAQFSLFLPDSQVLRDGVLRKTWRASGLAELL